MTDEERDARLRSILHGVEAEYRHACAKHPEPMRSPHEGYAIILEEVDELWETVRNNTGRTGAAVQEAYQIAATAVRYLMEVTK